MLTTYTAKTDCSCVIDGLSYPGLPLLFTAHEVLEEQSDYLRELSVKRGLSSTSVNEMSKYLRTHVHIMDSENLCWKQTHEVALRRWRNEKAGKDPSNARRRYLNQQLQAFYQFLIWAQRTGRISGVVGPLSQSDTSRFLLPVEISRWHSDGTPSRFKFPLLYRTVGESDQRNATSKDVNELFVALADEPIPFIAERNQLIARFAENALMRRHEIAALIMSQIPSLETAERARAQSEELTISLHITKGMKARETLIDPQLVIDTWTFIYGSRSIFLTRKLKRDAPDLEVFLSWRTAKRLHPESITTLFAKKQRQAGITRASPHHLRSIGSTNRVEALIDMYEQDGAPVPDEDTLLLQVKELLGHASVATSRKYIRRERKRQLDRKRGEHRQLTDRAEQLKQLDREIAIRQDQLRRLGA